MTHRAACRLAAFVLVLVSMAAVETAVARPIIIIKDPQLYVYPGSFPCTPGPGFCERWIIIALAVKGEPVDFDYTQSGNIQMAASIRNKSAYLADVKKDLPIPAEWEPWDKATVEPTFELDEGLE